MMGLRVMSTPTLVQATKFWHMLASRVVRCNWGP